YFAAKPSVPSFDGSYTFGSISLKLSLMTCVNKLKSTSIPTLNYVILNHLLILIITFEALSHDSFFLSVKNLYFIVHCLFLPSTIWAVSFKSKISYSLLSISILMFSLPFSFLYVEDILIFLSESIVLINEIKYWLSINKGVFSGFICTNPLFLLSELLFVLTISIPLTISFLEPFGLDSTSVD